MMKKDNSVFLGLSGFSYPTWKGVFYPVGTASQKMLEYYSSRFNSVEINSSLYRTPASTTLKTWSQMVSRNFVFSFKAHQRITHQKRLVNAEKEVESFIKTLSHLESRLRPILF